MAKAAAKQMPIGAIIAGVLVVCGGLLVLGWWLITRSAEQREDKRAALEPARRLKLEQVLSLPLTADLAALGRAAKVRPILGAVRVPILSTSFHKAVFRWDADDASHVASLELSRSANLSRHPQAAQLVARMTRLVGASRLSGPHARLTYRHGGVSLMLRRDGSRLGVRADPRQHGWKGRLAAFARALRSVALGEPLAEAAATRAAMGL